MLIAGCASAPTNTVIIERGAKPDYQQGLELVHAALKRALRDYDSMKDFAVYQNDFYPITATNFAYNFEQAWMLCVEYNAKNAYGGYTGMNEHGFPIRIGTDGKPYIVSTANWRTHANGSCY